LISNKNRDRLLHIELSNGFPEAVLIEAMNIILLVSNQSAMEPTIDSIPYSPL